jgi:hypothetical protein
MTGEEGEMVRPHLGVVRRHHVRHTHPSRELVGLHALRHADFAMAALVGILYYNVVAHDSPSNNSKIQSISPPSIATAVV